MTSEGVSQTPRIHVQVVNGTRMGFAIIVRKRHHAPDQLMNEKIDFNLFQDREVVRDCKTIDVGKLYKFSLTSP